MGADRQRHQADQSDGYGDRAAGDAKLHTVHLFNSQSLTETPCERARQLVAPVPFRFEGLPKDVPSNYDQFAALQQRNP
jgi:hypothetical protein